MSNFDSFKYWGQINTCRTVSEVFLRAESELPAL